ncbi:V4R domain protein [uncultured archaeon]|nr:V4R domain protein [uncultured archaeon]
MFEVVSKLMLHKQLEFEEGSIKLLGQNVVIFPFENLFSMQKIIEESGKTIELYSAAKELGKSWIKGLFKAYKMNTIEEQAEWGEKVFTLAGLGKMKVVEWNAKDSIMVYRVYDSIIAQHSGKVGHAVCHIQRGWFAGASCVFFGKDIDGIEVKCLSKGDAYCEFITKPRNKFDFKDKEVKQQLH